MDVNHNIIEGVDLCAAYPPPKPLLPITGASPAPIAGAGFVLVAVGVLLLGVVRRTVAA